MPQSKFSGLRFVGLLAGFSLFVSGCSQGPDSASLKDEVQSKLDTQFSADLFEVQSLTRNGSYPFSIKGDPKARLLVYFKAKIKFNKDYSLGQWDQLNAGSLGNLLGTTTEGVSGINPEGNKAGDIMKVFGTSTYIKEDGKWKSVRAVTPKQAKGRGRSDDGTSRSVAEGWLNELSDVYRGLENSGQAEQVAAFEHQIWQARRNIYMQVDQAEGRIGLLTGGEDSSYSSFGMSLHEVAKTKKLKYRDYRSAGSVANCQLVASQKTDFGIVQSDVAKAAFLAEAPFLGNTAGTELRSVCSLFPEAVQIVTLAKNNLTQLSDLIGKRVDIGPVGSGTEWNAGQILKAHGIAKEQLNAVSQLSSSKALKALEEGKLEAVFLTTAYPARPVEALATRIKIRLLPMSAKGIAELAEIGRFFPKMVIPANTYQDQTEAVPSLGVTAMVVTHKDTPEEKINGLLEMIFSSQEVIEANKSRAALAPFRAPKQASAGTPVTSYVTKDSARLGLTIPLHPTAQAWLRKQAK